MELIKNALQDALQWINNLGWLGVLAYIALYILAAVLFIPGSLLTLGAGAIYGVIWGSIYVFIAATLGAIAAFLVGRYFAQSWVQQRIQGKATFQAIANSVSQQGFRLVLLTRLSPIFPFTLLNYAYGVTTVSLKDYILGSVGMIPGTVVYVYIGSLAGSLTAIGTHPNLTPTAQTLQWALRLMGFAATVVVTVYITRLARQALAQTIDSAGVTDGSPEQK